MAAPPAADAGGAAEDERQLPAGLVPDRDRGVGDEHRGVGGDGRSGRGAQGRSQATHGPWKAEGVPYRGHAHRRPVHGEEPAAHAHGGGRLGHPQHVREALRSAQVLDQQGRSGGDGAEGRPPGPSGQHRIAGDAGPGRQNRRCSGQTAAEEVPRYARLPHGRLDDGPPVVGGRLELGQELGLPHRRPPTNAATALPTSVNAAAAAAAHICGRSRVVTTGSGGRP